MTEHFTNEVILYEGKNPIDLDRARKVWADLQGDKTHDNNCACQSCKYQLHRKQGGRFDKEAFFLYWLELEVKLSLINQTERLVFSPLPSQLKEEYRTSVDARDYFRVKGTFRALAEYVGKYFPEIDPDVDRIKLKLWRFRKSGVDAAVEEEIRKNQLREMPPNREGWQQLRLAQRIADYIYSRPHRQATQRELQRYIQRPVDEIEGIRGWLSDNYAIILKKGSRKGQVIYYGRMNSSKGRILKVGVDQP